MKTRQILGIVTVALGLGIAATAYVADAEAKGKGGNAGGAGIPKSFGGSAGLTKSVRDRRGQEPKVVNPPPKVVPPPRCIVTPTHCRPYDPYRSPGNGKRPQIQDHRS